MLCLILGYGARPLPLLRRILIEEGIEGMVLGEGDSERELEKVKEAKVIFAYSSRLPEVVEEAIKESQAKVVEFSGLGNVSAEVLSKAKAYYALGGEGNLRNLVRFLASLGEKRIPYEEPLADIPLSGIWHPELGIFKSPEDYLKAYPARPDVGILSWRNSLLYGDLRLLESLIRGLEGKGLGVLPVFYYPRDELTGLGEEGDEVLERFFIKEGRTSSFPSSLLLPGP